MADQRRDASAALVLPSPGTTVAAITRLYYSGEFAQIHLALQ